MTIPDITNYTTEEKRKLFYTLCKDPVIEPIFETLLGLYIKRHLPELLIRLDNLEKHCGINRLKPAELEKSKRITFSGVD